MKLPNVLTSLQQFIILQLIWAAKCGGSTVGPLSGCHLLLSEARSATLCFVTEAFQINRVVFANSFRVPKWEN